MARAHRWEVEIFNLLGGREALLYALSVDRPTFEHDKIVMHQGSNQIEFPGKYRFGTVELVIYEKVDDFIGNYTASFLHEWRKAVLNLENHSLLSGNSIQDVKRNIRITLTDGEGFPVYNYDLVRAWPQRVVPSKLDYSSSEISTSQVTLAFDWCEYNR
jgi:phage tail-like protein